MRFAEGCFSPLYIILLQTIITNGYFKPGGKKVSKGVNVSITGHLLRFSPSGTYDSNICKTEDSGLLKETYSFTYAISNPYILESDILGWVVSEEIFNQVRLQKNISILI